MKKIFEIKGQPGRFILNESCDQDMHQYGLYDNNGTEISTGYFKSIKKAEQTAKEQFNINDFQVKDLTEKEMNILASKYISCIKKIKPSFKKSHIVLDMSKLIYSRNPNDWCTIIPFTHSSNKYIYHERASMEWIEKEGES